MSRQSLSKWVACLRKLKIALRWHDCGILILFYCGQTKGFNTRNDAKVYYKAQNSQLLDLGKSTTEIPKYNDRLWRNRCAGDDYLEPAHVKNGVCLIRHSIYSAVFAYVGYKIWII